MWPGYLQSTLVPDPRRGCCKTAVAVDKDGCEKANNERNESDSM